MKNLSIILFLFVFFGSIVMPAYAKNENSGNNGNSSVAKVQIDNMKKNIKTVRTEAREEVKNIKENVKELRNEFRKTLRVGDWDDEDEDGDDTDQNNGGKKVDICHIPFGNPSAAHTITIARTAANAHLAHGDYAGRCTGDVIPPNPPTPDTNAPIIFGMSSNVAYATATIAWFTNEASDSRLWYSTTSPVVVGASNTFYLSNSNLVTNHNFSLNGLQGTTTYYYLVSSADSSGNRSTSTQGSFITSDFVAPLISGISVLHSTSSSATTSIISWLTDEGADSKLWFGTTTPLDLFSSLIMSTTSPLFVTSHQFVLTNLLPGVPYYYVISSADIFGNRSTTTEGSFLAP